LGVVVPLGGERDSNAPSLQRLQDLVAADMAAVQEYISARTDSTVDLVPELANHLIESGGKRLRPMLTIASAKLCEYGGKDHIKLAATVEFMHNATLLHDDVVDESDMRRGKPTARKVWGNQASVLVGDFLLGRAFQLMVETGSLKALGILADAAAIIAEGEVMQLVAARNTETTEDAYLQVIEAKTAALFAAASEIGAVIAGKSATEAAALHSYGRNLGIAFQLVDDALDYSGEAASLGKNVGDDFREGKITLPVVLAYRRGSKDERSFWQRTLKDGVREESDIDEALRLLEKHEAIKDTVQRARHYGSIADDALAIFPESEYRDGLHELVAFCISRLH